VSGGVFISYRREDSAGFARLIYDRLTKRLERANVFIDVDNIEPGLDFVEILSERVAKCDTLVAIIGRDWISTVDKDNRRRLDDPQDFVRIEIGAALERGVRVIPVLVEGAAMPAPDDLPDGLKKLARRQAIEISHTRFDSDVERLTSALELVEEELHRRAAAQAELATRDARQKREADEERRPHEARAENERAQTRSADAATAKSFRQAERELETTKSAQSPIMTDEIGWRNTLLNAFRLLGNKGLLIGSAIPESILEKARKYSGTDEILVIDHMILTQMHIFGLRGLYSHVAWNTKQLSWSDLRNCNNMRRHGNCVYIKENFMIVPQHMSSKELLKLLNFLRQEASLPTWTS
jgi:hypothetical protein